MGGLWNRLFAAIVWGCLLTVVTLCAFLALTGRLGEAEGRARSAGHEVGRTGGPPQACPHDTGPQRRAWLEGWEEGRRQAQTKEAR